MTIFAKNGWKYDTHATAMMIEDMLFDPILGAKVILGLEIPPHQELRLLWQWVTRFTIDDSGFSTGKTFTNAICMALRSVLMPNRISGVLAGTFRQGKLTYQYIERWSRSSKIFRNTIRIKQGKMNIGHGSEVHEAHFRGGSKIRVLPPNFHQDSDALRGERWNDGYFDEWTKYGSAQAITKTLIGRVTEANVYTDCPVRGNHIHMTSTPTFTHDPCYPIVEQVDKHIANGNRDYGRFTCNYRHVPKTKKWKRMVDRRVIYTMQTMNTPGVVKAEIDGLWQKDSMSFYESYILDNARTKSFGYLEKRLFPQDAYVLAFDTARGHNDNQRAEGDDFAAAVWRIPYDDSMAYPCHLVRKNNITAANMSGIIHDLHNHFNFGMILYDPGGGGLFIRDELMKPNQIIHGKEELVMPILDWIDTSGLIGYNLMIPFRRKHMAFQQLWGVLASDSVLINLAHGKFRAAIETKQVPLPPVWDGWKKADVTSNINDMRNFLMRATGISKAERNKAELDLAVRQLMQVDVVRDKAGSPVEDTYKMYKFKSKRKKDAAYSLLYGHTAVLAYRQMHKRGTVSSSNRGNNFACSTQAM